MTQAIVIHDEHGGNSVAPRASGALTAAFGAYFDPDAVVQQIQLVQQVMEKCMQDGTHFGTIPGCGDKPTLLKAGAEKLAFVFRLSPEFEVIERDLGEGHREYRITCTLSSINTGRVVGSGVGICSTMESKYRWRVAKTKCPTCGAETIRRSKFGRGSEPPGWYCHDKAGGCGAQFAHNDKAITEQERGRVENPDVADTYNTVLKMAKKRAQIDATLTATAASDIFTQDLEDMGPEIAPAPPPPVQSAPRPVEAASAPPRPAPVVEAAVVPPGDPSHAPGSVGPDMEIWFGRDKGKRVTQLDLGGMKNLSDWATKTWEQPTGRQAELLACLQYHIAEKNAQHAQRAMAATAEDPEGPELTF